MSNKQDDKDLKITDVVKKIVTIGVGAAFMTEDAIRSTLQDLPLPKDIINGLVNNAKSAKEDFADSVQQELRTFLSKVNLTRLVEDIVEKYDFEVNATVSLKRKDEGEVQTPKSKSKAKAKTKSS